MYDYNKMGGFYKRLTMNFINHLDISHEKTDLMFQYTTFYLSKRGVGNTTYKTGTNA